MIGQRTPRPLAAKLISISHEYPSTLSEGERALVVEVEAVREQLRLEISARRLFAEAAYKFQAKYNAARLEVEQLRGEAEMYHLLLDGYQGAARPTPSAGRRLEIAPRGGQGA